MTKLAALHDDFEDGVINSSLWDVVGTASESSGRLILTPISGSTLVTTDIVYDLTSSQVVAYAPVVTPIGTTGTLQCGMTVRNASDDRVAIRKLSDEILGSQVIGGVATDLFVGLYGSGAQYLWWKIRITAGTLYLETSPDNITWTVRYSAAAPFDMSAVYLQFFSGFSSPEASPGDLQIETINPVTFITASAASSSFGSAKIFTRHKLSASGTSTSSGSAATTIPPLGFHTITASGDSLSSGTAFFITLAPDQMTASGASYSSGVARISLFLQLTGVGVSYSTGSASFTITTLFSSPLQYFFFEPPVAYDNPPTLPDPRPRYINAHARWKGGQRRGRSVLRTGSTCTVMDTPTVDETLAADRVYMGGHIYTIDSIEAEILSNCGLAVTPIPTIFTIYPDLKIYPDLGLFPGYPNLP